jgi:hypothetical protein
VSALYLTLDVTTALIEYQQISPLMPPGTLVTYGVTVDPVVDFSNGYVSGEWPDLWEDFYCDWRACWFNQIPKHLRALGCQAWASYLAVIHDVGDETLLLQGYEAISVDNRRIAGMPQDRQGGNIVGTQHLSP